jgi:hypothetical protein
MAVSTGVRAERPVIREWGRTSLSLQELHQLGYNFQPLRKTREGSSHPDRLTPLCTFRISGARNGWRPSRRSHRIWSDPVNSEKHEARKSPSGGLFSVDRRGRANQVASTTSHSDIRGHAAEAAQSQHDSASSGEKQVAERWLGLPRVAHWRRRKARASAFHPSRRHPL